MEANSVRIWEGHGRLGALMESFKEWILGFSDSVKFLGTKIGYEEVTIGRLAFERRAWVCG